MTAPDQTDPPLSSDRDGILTKLLGLIDGSYIDTEACDRAFDRMHTRDAIGDKVHLGFALFWCVLLFSPQSVMQIAAIPLVVFFFVRVINTFPLWIHGFGQPAMLAALALASWMGITLLWSPDRVLGADEIAQLRWFAAIGVLYPAIRSRRLLIYAMLVGYASMMIAQIFDAFDGFGNRTLYKFFWHESNRISGWTHPVVAGSMFVAGLGLVLPAALFDQRRRVLWIIASVLMCVSIFATGSRGAWIATIPLVLTILAFGFITKRLNRRVLLGVLSVGIASIAIVSLAAGDNIKQRANEARIEISEALQGNYNSHTGARIRMAQLAIETTIQHPIVGVGAGGYKHDANARDDTDSFIHDHAHNTPLQLSATTGLVGVLLAAALFVTLVRNAHSYAKHSKTSGFALGPMFAIIGLLCVSMTDTVLINTQTAALLATLAALSPAYVPRSELPRSDPD
jgi:O-antigen ligase